METDNGLANPLACRSDHRITRRAVVLRAAAGIALAPAAVSLLAACGSSAASSTTTSSGSGGAAATSAASPTPFTSSTGTTSAATETPKEGGTITLGISANLETPDPQKASTGTQTMYAKLLTDTLVQFDPKGNVLPLLAEKWEASADGKTFTFSLVKNATFHDGAPFNAAAVKTNFARIMDPKFAAFLRDPVTKITTVTAVDDYTVAFTISIESGLFIPNMTWANLGMVSPTALQQKGAGFANSPVGIGPFKFVEYIPDQHVKLTRNDNYWAGKPHIDTVMLQVIPDDSTRELQFETGGIDINTSVLYSNADRLTKDYVLFEGARFGFEWFAMNLSLPDFQDVRMRQVMAYAINREPLIQQVYYGHADPGVAGIPPATWGFDSSVKAYPYDTEKAKALLDEIGWKAGADGMRSKDGKPLSYTLRTSTSQQTALQTQIIQQQLKDVGIASQINSSEANAFFTDMRAEKFQLGVWSLGGIGDANPAEYASSFSTDYYWNPSRHHIAAMDNLINQMEVAQTQTTSKTLASQYQQLMIQNQPAIWLLCPGILFSLQKKLRGVVITSDNLIHLQSAWIE